MKVGKKLLSVFLAVIMIMSSMSVCFGIEVFAATGDTNAFIKAVKCDAMESFSATKGKVTKTGNDASKSWGSWSSNNTYVVTAPFTVTVTNYTDYTALINVIKTFNNAVQSLPEYQNKHSHNTDTACIKETTDNCTDFAQLKSALISDIGTSTYNTLKSDYNLDDFLDVVLNTDFGDYSGNVYMRPNPQDSGTTGYTSSVAQEVINKLTVSISADNFMKSFSDPADIPDGTDGKVNLSYEYKTAMGRQNYSKSEKRNGDWWSKIYYYYHSCVNTQQLGYFSQTTEGTATTTNKAVLVAMKNALVDNKDYLDETTVSGVHKISTNTVTLNAAAKAIEDAFKNVGTGLTNYFNYYFNTKGINVDGTTYKIAYSAVTPLVALIKKAATISEYKSACETIAKDYAIYTAETYKTYTSTEVNALYNELKTAYDNYKAADDTMEAEIATYYGIDGYIADIPEVLDALLAYYYKIFLGSIKDRAYGKDGAQGYITTWNSWTVEDIDNDVITSADILTALKEVTLDINTLNTDATDADVQGYFGMSKAALIAELTAVKTHLEELGYYAGLNDELYAQYATFTNNISGVIDADTATLYSVLSGYEAWHQNLQSFFTTWSAEVGSYKDLLEDDLQATMNAYMQEAYAALKARIVVEINYAYDLYTPYYKEYGNTVTMASLTYFNNLKKAIKAIHSDAYNWLKNAHYTYGTAIDADTIAKYDALQVIYNAYGTFVANRGFDTYTQTFVGTARPDTDKDIARENENGVYNVADDDINKIIDLLEAALKDPEIAKLLGDLINKDKETGLPTGEPFSLSGLVTGLLDDVVFTDDLVNTIISFLYPVVAQAFLDVWIGINPIIDTKAETDLGTLPVHAKLKLYDVDTAIENAGVALAPVNLAHFIERDSTWATKYSGVISTLKSVTAQTSYSADGTYSDPWKSGKILVDVIDEETGLPVVNEETGETKKKLNLDWGIDDATDKRSAFVDAASAALCGLEPLLKALLLNQKFVSPNIENDKQRGGKIGSSVPGTTVQAFGLTLDLTLDPITLMLDMSANDGWDNVLAPLFELLGLENIPHSEDMHSVREFLNNGLLAMIDQLVGKLDAHPLQFILDVIPNLVYALEADLLAPVLNFLETNIYYEADTHYSANAYVKSVTGDLAGVMKAEEPAYINVGEMLDLESMGLNLSGGLAGILEMLNINLPNLDVSVLATAGTLDWRSTNRSKFTYSYAPAGKEGKAAHIVANRADLLEYLFKWALGNLDSLLALLKLDTSTMGEAVTAIFANLAANADDATAGVVELLNQKVYNTLESYEWYTGEGYVTPTDSRFTPATQIYMNPGNDWTEAKAQYLYDNLEGLLASIFTLAKLDLDKETPEVDGSIEGALDGLVGGLLSDKTLTALAGLLAKLDLNALLAPKDEAAEGEETPDANEPETVAEGEDATEGEAAAVEIDVNALVKNLLGIDLAAVAATYAPIAAELEANPEYVYDFGVDAGKKTFAAALKEMVAPLGAVLDFILTGGDLAITFAKGTANEKAATLIGYDGYNNAIIPLLEALGCTAPEQGEMNGAEALEATVNALVGLIDKLTTNTEENAKDGAIYTIIDLLPGLLYFIASDGLTTTVRNLLQPVYVILDTIRPIYDVDLAALIAGIEIGEEGNKKPLGLDLNNLGVETIIDLVANLTGLNLTELKTLIYDVCKYIGVEYKSTSTLQTTWKKGAYITNTEDPSKNFTQADLLTVLLSYILEWATVKANAEKLDELLKTNGIIAALSDVFASVEITYAADPNWMYWFADETAFNKYLAGNEDLPNTLYALEYPNDWTEAKAKYIAAELPALVDMIIGLINKDKADAPATLSALLNKLIADNINADTLNDLVGMIAGLLEGVDDNLLELAGYILGDSSTDKKEIDIVGLKAYKCKAEINDLSDFINELANVLDTYASGLINWLFFGDDFRFAKKSDNTDTIVINGGLGYEKGLALILEALGCALPAEANTKSVLGALADRVDAILAKPVDEVIGLLPNLIYFLNANGVGVAVNNLLQPVNALLEKLAAFGLNISLADLIKFEVNGETVTLDLANLSLANVVEILKKALPGFNFAVVEDYLVNFCTGKITAGEYIYKMTAPKEDVVTIILTIALLFVKDEANAAKLDEMLNINIISTLDEVFKSTPVEYLYPDYNYFNGEINVDKGTIEVMENAITYPNDWTETKSAELAKNLPALVDAVIKMIAINGVKYDSLEALLNSLLSEANVFSAKTLNDLVGLIANLLANVDDQLLKFGALLNVDIVGLKSYNCTKEIKTVEEFADELAFILNTYAKGIVEWLLLGDDIKLGVSDVDAKGTKLEGEDIITINGAHGYAEGLALILEALGCKNLPAVYGVENLKTEDVVSDVLASLAARIDEILDNPVDEIINLLPNIIYFLNANGVATSVNNLAGAFNALALKLKSFGLNITLEDLVDLKALMGLEGTDANISLKNLTIADLLEAVSLMTGLDLTVLNDVLTGFALGEVKAYESVSSLEYTAKMEFTEAKDKHDMITVLVTAALLTVVENKDNAAKLDEMLKLEPGIVSALKDVFAEGTISYEKPDWNYNLAANGTVNAMKYAITYPNNWSEATAEYVTTTIMSKEFDALVAGLIDSNYASLSDLLNDKVNVFTADTLNSLVGLIANLLGDIDEGLIKAAGVLLDVNVAGLKTYKCEKEINNVKDFADELANILNTYASGVVEWLLLGNDYRFFVKDVAENEAGEKIPVDFIVINGAEGYANGLALLLEALGCTDLPAADGSTDAIVTGVLTSLANRISAILANPIEEVINLLPNLLYFLNTNGVAAVVKNTTAALTALLNKLAVFNIKLDLNELVNLKKLMKIENTDAKISLDNLTVEALLEAASYMVEGLDLTLVKDVIVNFGLVEAEAYTSVSNAEAVGAAKKMGYEKDVFEAHDMVTVLANLVLLTIVDEDNAKFVKGLVGDEIYQVILNLLDMQEADIQEFSWLYTDKEGKVFSTLTTSGVYDDWPLYGPHYTEEMATYIADNFGMFVDNILYLLGLEINGVQINDLTTLINELLDGSLYNSSNVIAIRDALAGVLANVEKLEVKGVVVGGYIADVLKAAGVADIKAVATVEVPTFSENREMFVTYLCKVLEPLYGVLKYVLANEDISFFVDLDKSDLITLKGGEGYVYGIIPILEVLGCSMNKAEAQAKAEAKAKAMGVSVDKVKVSSWIVAPEDYYAMLDETSENYNPNILITSILDVLLDRVDEIIENPADEILGILPNLIYFINSNGLDTVVKNTLNAVYSLLGAIKPIAKIDIYDLIGVDLAKINMNYLVDELLKLLAKTGYNFTADQLDPIAELTVGKLEKYTSVNGKTAYRMVYAPEVGAGGGSAELVTVILRLAVTFLMHEKNATLLVDFLSNNLGMSPDARNYLLGIIKSIAKVPTTTFIGMDQALAVIYYLFYSADIGAGSVAGGLKDINAEWGIILKELSVSDNPEEETIGSILKDLMDKYTGDVLEEDGVAPNGLIKFFQKIADWFNSIIEWFKNLFK